MLPDIGFDLFDSGNRKVPVLANRRQWNRHPHLVVDQDRFGPQPLALDRLANRLFRNFHQVGDHCDREQEF